MADVLATMRGRGFAALHYFEQMAPEVKEEAYVAVSGWLAAELPNMAAVASTSAAPEPAGWKQAGINSSLLLGGGLLLGAPVLALGAAVVGGVIGYRQAAEEIAVFDCLRECGRGILEPLVILLHAAPELRDVPPASWRPTLDRKGTQLARQLLDATYRHQCTAKFTPLAAAAGVLGSEAAAATAAGIGEGGGKPFLSQDTLRTVYECACALRVSHSGPSAIAVWAEHLSLQLIESEWDHTPGPPLLATSIPGRGDARNAAPASDIAATAATAAAADATPPPRTQREPGWRLIRSKPSDAARARGEPPLLIVALCGVDAMGDLLGDVEPGTVDSLPGLRVHRRMHAAAVSTLQRLVPALLPHRGQGLHLRIVGHSTGGGISLLILLELLLAPPLGLGGHAGSLRDGFESIRALGFGAPLAIASLPPPALPVAKPSAAHDAKPTLKPATDSSSSGAGGSIGGESQGGGSWPPRPSGMNSLPASSSTSSLSGSGIGGGDAAGGGAAAGFDFDVDGPDTDFSGLAVGRGRSFSGSFNLGADASVMTAGWRARLIGNSQKDPDAWGSGIARAVASVPPPGGWIRAMTGATDQLPDGAGGGGVTPRQQQQPLGVVGGGSMSSLSSSPPYEELAVPPLPGAVASAGAHYDLFCHQYDVVPRLFGPGNGDATADSLRLLLPSSGGGGGGVGVGGVGGGEGGGSPTLTPEKKAERVRREKTARSMAGYGLLGSVHLVFSLPEAEWHDEWKDSDDEDEDEDEAGQQQQRAGGSSLPHVLSAAAEQEGSAQQCCCVSIPTSDEERWLRLPPLPYLRHGAEDHQLSRYVDVLGAACGEKVAPLLAPIAQPGPLPLAPRPQVVPSPTPEPEPAPSLSPVGAVGGPPRTTTDPEVWEACRLDTAEADDDSAAAAAAGEQQEGEEGESGGGGLMAGVLTSLAENLAWAAGAAAPAPAPAATTEPQPQPELQLEPQLELQPQPEPEPQPQPQPEPEPELEPETDEI